MAQLKEQNKRLLQRLEESEREEHSHTPISTPQTHQSRTKPPTLQIHGTHHGSLTHHTHQSFKYVTPDKEENPRGHPFMDNIIAAPFPDKWRGLTMNLYDGSTDHLELLWTNSARFVWGLGT